MILRNENIHPGDSRAKRGRDVMIEGEKSDQMFVPIILEWFGLVIRGRRSEHMDGSFCSTISLMPCEEGAGQISVQHRG